MHVHIYRLPIKLFLFPFTTWALLLKAVIISTEMEVYFLLLHFPFYIHLLYTTPAFSSV